MSSDTSVPRSLRNCRLPIRSRTHSVSSSASGTLLTPAHPVILRACLYLYCRSTSKDEAESALAPAMSLLSMGDESAPGGITALKSQSTGTRSKDVALQLLYAGDCLALKGAYEAAAASYAACAALPAHTLVPATAAALRRFMVSTSPINDADARMKEKRDEITFLRGHKGYPYHASQSALLPFVSRRAGISPALCAHCAPVDLGTRD